MELKIWQIVCLRTKKIEMQNNLGFLKNLKMLRKLRKNNSFWWQKMHEGFKPVNSYKKTVYNTH